MNDASTKASTIVETVSRGRCVHDNPPGSRIERQKFGVRAKPGASGKAGEDGTLAGGSLPVKAA